MSRWVELVGADNVRDLGGLPVAGNRTTRSGVVFRSGTPQQLTAEDLAFLLADKRLRTVIDLRHPQEARQEAYGLLADADVHRVLLPLATPAGAVPDARRDALTDHYLGMLAGSGTEIVSAARLIGDDRRHSVLFHCAAGKDRTGVLAAVVLHAVGVPADAIAEDFALSAERLERIGRRLATMPTYQGASLGGSMAVVPEVMHRFLDGLVADFGGGAEWLLDNGLTPAELETLRTVLVE
ncbi:MAG TPA: tyrosine-protein phosphatase [Pseudonocardiaceae bacterium]|jgi:protein tyrosine/serine phosphatase|nr:tyrosine-protein phosphatase [Pseudonocardiaceae bacterium]